MRKLLSNLWSTYKVTTAYFFIVLILLLLVLVFTDRFSAVVVKSDNSYLSTQAVLKITIEVLEQYGTEFIPTK